MAFDVLVVTHDSADQVGACLASLRQAVGRAGAVVEVTVWDNASSDGTPELVEAAGWRLLRSDRNLGFAAGCNRAAAATGEPWLVLLNPDCRLEPTALAALAASAGEAERSDILVPRLMDEAGRPEPNPRPLPSATSEVALAFGGRWAQGAVDRLRSALSPQHQYASGAFFVVSRQLWERLGGFDEGFFLYGEEADFCARALEAGARLRPVPEAGAVHLGGQGSAADPAERMAHALAGKRRYLERHAGPRRAAWATAARRVGASLRRTVRVGPR